LMPGGPADPEECARRCYNLGKSHHLFGLLFPTLTWIGTSVCSVSGVSGGTCYYGSGLTNILSSQFPVEVPGYTCDQALAAFPPYSGMYTRLAAHISKSIIGTTADEKEAPRQRAVKTCTASRQRVAEGSMQVAGSSVYHKVVLNTMLVYNMHIG
jgi:hypothetical protein